MLGIAAKRLTGHILVPADFVGGESSKCFRVLPKAETLEKLRAAISFKPSVNLTPKQRLTVVHYRSEAVKRYVLAKARGRCEGCENEAPFKNKKNQPYLEPHHTTRRADGGPDAPGHVIALCPNCHRRVHSGIDGETFNQSFIRKLKEIEPSI